MGKSLKINNKTQSVEDIKNDVVYLHNKGYSFKRLSKLLGPTPATLKTMFQEAECEKLKLENAALRLQQKELSLKE